MAQICKARTKRRDPARRSEAPDNRIARDHAALKQRLRPMRSFRTLAGAEAALATIETFRTKKCQFASCKTGVANAIALVANLFPKAA